MKGDDQAVISKRESYWQFCVESLYQDLFNINKIFSIFLSQGKKKVQGCSTSPRNKTSHGKNCCVKRVMETFEPNCTCISDLCLGFAIKISGWILFFQ